MSMYANVPTQPWPSPTLLRRSTTSPGSTTTTTSPVSPTRTGRLRGLSYLRSYTQHHLLSRESSHSSSPQRPNLGPRATSYPSPPTQDSAAVADNQDSAITQPVVTDTRIARTTSPTAQRSTTDLSPQDSIAPTSGWLPTVGGQSGVSRIGTEPQSTATASSSAVLSGNGPSAINSDLTASMARTRSATLGGATDMPQFEGREFSSRNEAPSQAGSSTSTRNGGHAQQLPSIRFLSHQDPRAQRPSLVFSPMSRILPTGKEVIKVGRYSERDSQPIQAVNVPSAAPVGFKSKVVSRRHCEFWFTGGKWFIKDVKSSSGTFLNHIRLSSPGAESRPFPLNDGDIVQLGIDFKGGEEMIFRCVKIRVELNKGWQTGPSSFNVASHKRLREMMANQAKAPGGSSQDCSICLGPIQPCQSLFVAPCSHTWHYKCIRTIINGPNWPHFQCPNCRTVCDLEAELDEVPADSDWEELKTSDTEDTIPAPRIRTDHESSTVAPNGSESTESMLAAVLSANSNHTEQGSQARNTVDRQNTNDRPASSFDRVSEDLENLHIHEESSQVSDDIQSDVATTNSSVAPIEIVRKPVGSVARQPERSGSNSGQERSRTPSPAIPGHDGPMTPRNDVGPFIFDGTAGRNSGARPVEAATINLDAAATIPTPPQQPTPEPVS